MAVITLFTVNSSPIATRPTVLLNFAISMLTYFLIPPKNCSFAVSQFRVWKFGYCLRTSFLCGLILDKLVWFPLQCVRSSECCSRCCTAGRCSLDGTNCFCCKLCYHQNTYRRYRLKASWRGEDPASAAWKALSLTTGRPRSLEVVAESDWKSTGQSKLPVKGSQMDVSKSACNFSATVTHGFGEFCEV